MIDEDHQQRKTTKHVNARIAPRGPDRRDGGRRRARGEEAGGAVPESQQGASRLLSIAAQRRIEAEARRGTKSAQPTAPHHARSCSFPAHKPTLLLSGSSSGSRSRK